MSDQDRSLPQDVRALQEQLATLRQERDQHAGDLAALMAGARSILRDADFATTARALFDYCCARTGATSGYVALLSEDGAENELLFLEAGGLPCTVDPALPMPIRGLRSQCYREGRAVFENDFMRSEWAGFLPGGHCDLRNVMFAPLVLDGAVVGIIGVANKPTDFDDNDAHIAAALGELAAIALQNSREAEARAKAEAAREHMILDLQTALDQVQRLSGMLPICASCKKIRNDSGYWEAVDTYIAEHSEAVFSHAICPECSVKLYPELYEDENATDT